MTRVLTFTLFVALLATAVAADFQSVINEVKTYEYGDSRETLTTLTDMLRQASEDPAKLAEYEAVMLEALSDKETTFAAKQFLCKELSIMGTEQSVDVLYDLLTSNNPKNADIARYALERIPGDEVDAALLKALKKTKGTIKVGVINTVGERGIKDATKPLSKLLENKDAAIAKAAAAALGKMGTDASATALGDALTTTTGETRDVVVDAYLKNADAFLQAGEKNKALAIYESLYVSNESLPTRAAALTGLVKTVENPTELIVNTLKSDTPKELKAVAISMVHQCKRDLDVNTIAEQLPSLEPLGQIQLLTAFKVRGSTEVRETAADAVESDNLDVSLTALEALAAIGDKSDALLLAQIAANSTGETKETAQQSLARLSAPGVNETILTAIPNAEEKVKVEMVEAVGNRQMAGAVPNLLTAAKDENVRVRVAALKSLGQVAAPSDLPALIELLVNAQNNTERREAERTVVTVANSIDEKENRGDAIMAVLSETENMEAKSSLMLVLGRLGDPDALPVMRDALNSENDELKRAAILSLSEWPTPEPADDLLEVAKSAESSSHQVLALRGYIQLAGLESDRPKPETVAMYKTALELAENVGEKRMALSGLAQVGCIGAMKLAGEYLDNSELKGEAEIAVLQNAWSTRNEESEERTALVKKVYDQTSDERVKNQAGRMLN